MARHEGDPVPYEHEFYSTVLKGIFSLDLDNIGVFYKSEKTGYRNMYSELEAVAEKNGAEKVENKWIMPAEIRIKRAKDVLKALPYLSGGAKQTSHLTDVSPKILILVGNRWRKSSLYESCQRGEWRSPCRHASSGRCYFRLLGYPVD